MATSVVRDLMATTVVTDRTTLISDVATTPISDLRTVKALDDVKSPAMDKQFTDVKLPGSDVFDPGGPVVRPGGAARPFILANPHHAMVTETVAGGALSALDYEAVIGELSQALQARQEKWRPSKSSCSRSSPSTQEPTAADSHHDPGRSLPTDGHARAILETLEAAGASRCC